MKYKAVLFDLDGTVMDTIEDLNDAVNFTLREFGLPEITRTETMRYVGNGARRLMEQSVPAGTDPVLFETILGYYVNYYQEHCMVKTGPYPGIPALLEQLHAAGLRQVIISNKPDAATKEIAERFFPGIMESVVGEREGLRRKPWPDMVFAAIETLGLTGEECVLIGDSEVDITTAKNAGVDCISVLWGFREEVLLRNAGAKTLVRTPEELAGILLA